MAVDLARYIVSLEAQTATYVKELDKANRKLDRFHKDQERALAKVKQAFFNFGLTLASALSVTAIVNFTKASLRMADELGEIAAASGITAKNLQELRFAFDELGGISHAETDRGLERFNRQLGLAINGSRQAQQQFKLLGVAFKDSFGRGLGTEATLEATLKALSEIENDAQRAAIAGRLFGEEMGPKLSAALRGGAQALADARKEVTGIISDESVRQASALDDAFRRMAGTISGPLRNAAIGVAFEFAKMFGFVEDAPIDVLNKKIADTQTRIRQLQESIAVNERLASQGGILGFLQGANAAKERITVFRQQIAQLQMNLAALEAAAHSSSSAVAAVGDGLEEIKVGPIELPVSLRLTKGPSEQEINQALFGDGLGFIQAGNGKTAEVPVSMQLMQIDQNEIDALFEPIKEESAIAADVLGADFRTAFDGWILGTERSFKDMLKRMAVAMATSALFKGLASLFPGGSFLSNFFGGARAHGGPVSAGRAYLVGERGPEIFVPSGSGMVAAGASGSINYYDYTSIDARGADQSLIARLPAILAQNREQTKAEIRDLLRGPRRRF